MGIKVSNLSFGYIKKPLCLKNVSFDVKSGETMLLLGGEGMGKTSLLRILCGLETLYVGRVSVEDSLISAPEEKTNISYLPSEPVFFENKTVEQNLNYLFEVEGIDNIDKEDLKEIFEMFNLNIQLGEKIKKLSLFNKRLLAIVRSYIKNAKVLLIDDQFEGLEKEEITSIKNAILLLKNAKNTTKTTVLAINNEQIDFKCDKIAYLSYAKLSVFSNMSQLEKSGEDLFVYDYVSCHKKEVLVTLNEGAYYLFDFERNKDKKGKEEISLGEKYKLSSEFNDKLKTLDLLEEELFNSVLVYPINIENVNDSVINLGLKNNDFKLFEWATGARII